MNNIAVIHNLLTSKNPGQDPRYLVVDFAKELGWNPSYFIEPSFAEKSNGYLVIEHGLQNSAIISFLKERNEDLTAIEEENLLSISYNNLVNWHITVDSRYISYYYILNKEKSKVETRKIEKGNEKEALSVSTFYEVIGKKPNSNIRALDDVLIENLSNWKRVLSAELHNNLDLVSLSHLFNAIIFLRSLEDSKKRADQLPHDIKVLLDLINLSTPQTLYSIITTAEEYLSISIPLFIVDKERIKLFDGIYLPDILRFFKSFYENDYNRFKYDFSIMTKQALSRVYQKYVSLLSHPIPSDQLTFFSTAPLLHERINKEIGAYYTPEYIARFFAKYISKQFTEKEYDKLQILEPAIGSGIFVRTLLETIVEQRLVKGQPLNINTLFTNVTGIDNDPNACLASNLSLTLLYYIFEKNFIKPNVLCGDSLKIMEENIENNKLFDIVISNPPYISNDNMSNEASMQYKTILQGLTKGKTDAYQAFLKLSIDILKPNGLGLFVLPHNFLVSESSKKLRNYLLEFCSIDFVADLSSINVFQDVNTYTILLGFRKKILKTNNEFSWLLKARTSVGEALSLLLQNQEAQQKQFQIYKAQNYFLSNEDWYILNKPEFKLLEKIKRNEIIDNFLSVHQGIITGNDAVFIRSIKDIDKKEQGMYKWFLPDKDIDKFLIENNPSKVVFYPYKENHLLSEEVLSKDYPDTWEYLTQQKPSIDNYSGDVRTGKRIWYSLHRPRNANFLNSSKIVSPYLSITPKFALDIEGKFVTSRSPYFVLTNKELDADLLYFFIGILNSVPCYWALSLQSHKQANGYNIFHLNLLKTASIPDPTFSENSALVSKMIITVKRRIIEKSEAKRMLLENEINRIACELYQLTQEEISLLGLDYEY